MSAVRQSSVAEPPPPPAAYWRAMAGASAMCPFCRTPISATSAAKTVQGAKHHAGCWDRKARESRRGLHRHLRRLLEPLNEEAHTDSVVNERERGQRP